MGVRKPASCAERNCKPTQIPHFYNAESEINWKNPPSSPNLQSKTAPPPLLFFDQEDSAAGRMTEMHCQLQDSQQSKTLPLLGSRPLAVVSGARQQGREMSLERVTPQAHGFGVWENLCHHSSLEGKTLAMKRCVPPLETLSTEMGNIIAHRHPENPISISYPSASSPAPSHWAFRLSLFCTEQASWKNCPGFHPLEDSFTSPSPPDD